MDALVDAINATGYGLTFGLHTRLDATIERVTRAIGGTAKRLLYPIAFLTT